MNATTNLTFHDDKKYLEKEKIPPFARNDKHVVVVLNEVKDLLAGNYLKFLRAALRPSVRFRFGSAIEQGIDLGIVLVGHHGDHHRRQQAGKEAGG